MYKFELTIMVSILNVYQFKNDQLVNYGKRFLVRYIHLSQNKGKINGSFQASGLKFSWFHLHDLNSFLLLWMPTNVINDTERWIPAVQHKYIHYAVRAWFSE